MLSAVTVTAADFTASRRFYDAVLGALGWERAAELVDEEEDEADVEAMGWGPIDSMPQLWLVRGSTATRGLHLRVAANARSDVETFVTLTEQHGGVVMSAPRRWTVYRRGEFSATVSDPDGNLIEAVAPE